MSIQKADEHTYEEEVIARGDNLRRRGPKGALGDLVAEICNRDIHERHAEIREMVTRNEKRLDVQLSILTKERLARHLNEQEEKYAA